MGWNTYSFLDNFVQLMSMQSQVLRLHASALSLESVGVNELQRGMTRGHCRSVGAEIVRSPSIGQQFYCLVKATTQ